METGPKESLAQKEPSKKKPKYTLEDLERERQWDSGNGPNNPGAFSRALSEHNYRLKEIEEYLQNEGVLPKPERVFTEEEKLKMELDKRYPNAKSKTIIDYDGKKYQIRYYPLVESRSGKTVKAWGHEWIFIEEK